MNIEVTRDNVTILEQSETPHENEYKITTCYFTFDDFTSSFQVKRAIFTILSTEEMYETDIINNQCDIPSEVLKHEYETVKLGVYGYNIGDNDELLNRFSPSYAEIIVPTGSYKEGALSPEPITPSQYDLYSQALQEGLQEVDDKLDEVVETVDGKIEEVDDKLEVVDGKIQDMDDALDDVDTAITETNNLNLDVSDKVDGDVTVTLTKKDASTKSVVISDGTSLMFNWDGTKLGVKTDEDSEYVYVDLQGIQGVPGPQGEPFRIKKTYSSVAEMNADFNNMQYGDYVMIASTVEIEDNAKLYTRGESQWIFITDFSGATGIKGETGATPNIQIGTVTSGSTPSVTRTGTNENPVLNFVLQPGEKGNTGDTGATGNGIASITKTSTSGLVDTYTITYTSGNTTTFNVTNGNGIDHISLTSQSGATKVYTIYFTDGNTTTFTVQDGEVTQEVFDEEIERANMIYNAMPKVSDEDTEFSLNNTAECPVYDIELSPSELEQETTTGKNLFNKSNYTEIAPNTRLGFDISKLTIGQTYTISSNLALTNIKISNTPAGYNSVIKQDLEGFTEHTFTMAKNSNIPSEATQYIFISTLADGDIKLSNVSDLANYNIQIEEGSTATSYEPFTYGASPNPQYPQEIHTVSGENSVKVGNKNLFNIEWLATDNITVENGVATGTARNFNLAFGATDKQLPNTNYKNKQISLSVSAYTDGNDSTSNNGGLTFIIRYTNGSLEYLTFNNNTTTKTKNTKTSNSNKEIKEINISYANSGANIWHISDFIITYTDTPQEYVPYTIQSLPLSLGNLEYCKIGDYEDEFRKSTGKNLFDKNTATTTGYLEETGDIHTSGAGASWRISDYINIQPNTTYTTSGMNTAGTSPSRCYYDENKNFISGIKHNGTNPFINTSPSNAYFMRESISNNDLDTAQVEEGNTATEWEPYESGKWYLRKNIGKVVLNGSESSWGIQETGTSNWFYRLAYTTNVGDISQYKPLSNYYKYAGISTTNTYQGIGVTSGYFRIRYGTEDTIANFKTWLSTHNVVVYYPISTPTYTLLSNTLQTQLDNIHKAITYQDQTNVSQENADLPFVIKLSAIRDLSGIFELIQG